ncbi:MAG: YqhV family protein [Firmicutes bacterium]|nr:YqhV family protein [Bacillota bacterium]
MFNELRTVKGMALLRFLAGTIEITAALLMLKLGRVKSAMKINSVLGLIGPLVLFIVSTLGIIGLSQHLSLNKMLIVVIGVLLILIGTR